MCLTIASFGAIRLPLHCVNVQRNFRKGKSFTRLVVSSILTLAVLIGQGASNLNLCLACAHVCFEADGSHDEHDDHEDHDAAFADFQCVHCTRTEIAPVPCDVPQFVSELPAPVVPHAFSVTDFDCVPLATESPPPPFAPRGAFLLLC